MAKHLFRYAYGSARHQGELTGETKFYWLTGPRKTRVEKLDSDIIVEGDHEAAAARAKAIEDETKAAIVEAESELRRLQQDRRDRVIHALKESK